MRFTFELEDDKSIIYNILFQPNYDVIYKDSLCKRRFNAWKKVVVDDEEWYYCIYYKGKKVPFGEMRIPSSIGWCIFKDYVIITDEDGNEVSKDNFIKLMVDGCKEASYSKDMFIYE